MSWQDMVLEQLRRSEEENQWNLLYLKLSRRNRRASYKQKHWIYQMALEVGKKVELSKIRTSKEASKVIDYLKARKRAMEDGV